jgi:hypothetical protein
MIETIPFGERGRLILVDTVATRTFGIPWLSPSAIVSEKQGSLRRREGAVLFGPPLLFS